MSFFKKAMNYLGLGPDDAYDDYDAQMDPDRMARPPRSSYGPDMDSGTVRTVPASARPPSREPAGGSRPMAPVEQEQAMVSVRPRAGSAVRTVPGGMTSARPHAVRPTRFDHAQEVADKFKDGQPVIVNLQEVNKDLQRRIIDFCAGLTYGLDGQMEKVGHGMYLLTPVNASLSPEDRRLIGEHDPDA
jgi:cell division inhibitor SepF